MQPNHACRAAGAGKQVACRSKHPSASPACFSFRPSTARSSPTYAYICVYIYDDTPGVLHAVHEAHSGPAHVDAQAVSSGSQQTPQARRHGSL